MFGENCQGGQSEQAAVGTSPSPSAPKHRRNPQEHAICLDLLLLLGQMSTNPSPPLAEKNFTALSVGACC